MILLVGGEKGGTGKTTIATNLAAMRAGAGRDVLLLDTDRQGSASFWAATRSEETELAGVACVQKFGKGLQSQVRDLAKRYQDVVIDAGGRENLELRNALAVAELALVPMRPSQLDVWSLARMSELIEEASNYNPELRSLVVLNAASTHPGVSEASETAEVVEEFENLKLARAIVRDRIAFRRAAMAGLSVAELTPADEKARAEVQALFDEVFA